MKRKATVAIFLDGRGCPFRCAFCNQKAVAEGKSNWTEEELDKLFTSCAKKGLPVEIGFYGGSFNLIDEGYRSYLLEWARKKVESGLVSGIRVSVRPDNLEDGILREMKESGVTVLELGVQILDDEVLEANKRGHSSKDAISAVKRAKRMGFYVSSHIMLGLYLATWEEERKTAISLMDAGTDALRIHPTLVLKGSLYEKWFKEGKYRPLTLEEALERVEKIVALAAIRSVEVLRIGLHPDPVLVKSVIAGPFHPSLGDMTRSRIFGRVMDEALRFGKTCYIECNPKDKGYLTGYRGENASKLEKLRREPFRVVENPKMPRFSISTEKISIHPVALYPDTF